MRNGTSDVVVVGTGITGAAATYALARRGVDVVALERFRVGHRNGSSHGASRIFRFSYPDAKYVRMAQRSLELWRALEDERGEELVRTIGGLDFGRSLEAHAGALEECGAHYEILAGKEIEERWPLLEVPADTRALFQPNAGIVYADRAWRAFVEGARSHGGTVEEATPATSLEREGDGLRVVTPEASLRARVVVVSAGPWAPSILAPLGVELPVSVSVETVGYFALEGALEVPSIVDWGDPSAYSLASPEPEGLKVGLHGAGPKADPDDAHEASQRTITAACRWLAKRFPAADRTPIATETCFYTSTPDQSFIFERHGPIVVASPCSGHGFKFAPLTGERVAALALGEGMP